MVAEIKPILPSQFIAIKPQTIEDKFSLALNTLGKLIFISHELDRNGIPKILSDIKLNEIHKRQEEVKKYIQGIYNYNNELQRILSSSPVNSLNITFKNIAHLNPQQIMINPVYELDNLNIHGIPGINTLLQRDSALLLTFITAKNCGLKSNNVEVKRGALNAIAIASKHLEYSLLMAKQINNTTQRALSNLQAIREILQDAQYKDSNQTINDIAFDIDSSLELIESEAYEHLNKIKSSFNSKKSA